MTGFHSKCECGRTAYATLLQAVTAASDIEGLDASPETIREAVGLLVELVAPTPETTEAYEAALEQSSIYGQRRKARTLRHIEPEPTVHPDLYFMHCPVTGLVKIGVSVDVKRRRNEVSLASGLPVEILHVVPQGGFELESKLHRQFAALRETGEWFRWEGPLAAHLERLTAA